MDKIERHKNIVNKVIAVLNKELDAEDRDFVASAALAAGLHFTAWNLFDFSGGTLSDAQKRGMMAVVEDRLGDMPRAQN
jgi:hypothetical protein